jgi:hypothetical protein
MQCVTISVCQTSSLNRLFAVRSISIAGTLRSAELKPELPNALFPTRPRESQALESMQRSSMNVPSRGIDDTPINANDRGVDDSIDNDDWLFDDLLETGMAHPACRKPRLKAIEQTRQAPGLPSPSRLAHPAVGLRIKARKNAKLLIQPLEPRKSRLD